ncbi:MAG: cell division protein FtsH, partial [Patescibacteria group bacterium]|nr:cell division protein FtsH [Patescibacteria group bacterium]
SYIGYGYDRQDYSDETARNIDLEVQRIVGKGWQSAKKILTEHRSQLDSLADLLLKKEVINADEFKAFIK